MKFSNKIDLVKEFGTPHRMMLKTKATARERAMGGAPFGSGVGHLVCTLLGAGLHSWFGPQVDQDLLVRRVASVASDRCVEHCRVDCSQYIVEQQFHWRLSVGLTLFSITGWFIVVLYSWCGGRKPVSAPIVPRSEESSPSSLEDRKSLAHLQLAEVRARGQRHVPSQ